MSSDYSHVTGSALSPSVTVFLRKCRHAGLQLFLKKVIFNSWSGRGRLKREKKAPKQVISNLDTSSLTGVEILLFNLAEFGSD